MLCYNHKEMLGIRFYYQIRINQQRFSSNETILPILDFSHATRELATADQNLISIGASYMKRTNATGGPGWGALL